MKHNSLVPHATTIRCGLTLAVLVGVLLASVPARADVDVRIDIGNAPPAPHLVFRDRPHERYFAEQGVYLVDDARVGDNDCFRYQGYYWVFRRGFWYRSISWRGRFFVVHPREVPTVFYQMPARGWKHRPSGPPGLMRKGEGGPPGQVKKGNSKHRGHGDR
jgi:hypothetical protein